MLEREAGEGGPRADREVERRGEQSLQGQCQGLKLGVPGEGRGYGGCRLLLAGGGVRRKTWHLPVTESEPSSISRIPGQELTVLKGMAVPSVLGLPGTCNTPPPCTAPRPDLFCHRGLIPERKVSSLL